MKAENEAQELIQAAENNNATRVKHLLALAQTNKIFHDLETLKKGLFQSIRHQSREMLKSFDDYFKHCREDANFAQESFGKIIASPELVQNAGEKDFFSYIELLVQAPYAQFFLDNPVKFPVIPYLLTLIEENQWEKNKEQITKLIMLGRNQQHFMYPVDTLRLLFLSAIKTKNKELLELTAGYIRSATFSGRKFEGILSGPELIEAACQSRFPEALRLFLTDPFTRYHQNIDFSPVGNLVLALINQNDEKNQSLIEEFLQLGFSEEKTKIFIYQNVALRDVFLKIIEHKNSRALKALDNYLQFYTRHHPEFRTKGLASVIGGEELVKAACQNQFVAALKMLLTEYPYTEHRRSVIFSSVGECLINAIDQSQAPHFTLAKQLLKLGLESKTKFYLYSVETLKSVMLKMLTCQESALGYTLDLLTEEMVVKSNTIYVKMENHTLKYAVLDPKNNPVSGIIDQPTLGRTFSEPVQLAELRSLLPIILTITSSRGHTATLISCFTETIKEYGNDNQFKEQGGLREIVKGEELVQTVCNIGFITGIRLLMTAPYKQFLGDVDFTCANAYLLTLIEQNASEHAHLVWQLLDIDAREPSFIYRPETLRKILLKTIQLKNDALLKQLDTYFRAYSNRHIRELEKIISGPEIVQAACDAEFIPGLQFLLRPPYTQFYQSKNFSRVGQYLLIAIGDGQKTNMQTVKELLHLGVESSSRSYVIYHPVVLKEAMLRAVRSKNTNLFSAIHTYVEFGFEADARFQAALQEIVAGDELVRTFCQNDALRGLQLLFDSPYVNAYRHMDFTPAGEHLLALIDNNNQESKGKVEFLLKLGLSEDNTNRFIYSPEILGRILLKVMQTKNTDLLKSLHIYISTFYRDNADFKKAGLLKVVSAPGLVRAACQSEFMEGLQLLFTSPFSAALETVDFTALQEYLFMLIAKKDEVSVPKIEKLLKLSLANASNRVIFSNAVLKKALLKSIEHKNEHALKILQEYLKTLFKNPPDHLTALQEIVSGSELVQMACKSHFVEGMRLLLSPPCSEVYRPENFTIVGIHLLSLVDRLQEGDNLSEVRAWLSVGTPTRYIYPTNILRELLLRTIQRKNIMLLNALTAYFNQYCNEDRQFSEQGLQAIVSGPQLIQAACEQHFVEGISFLLQPPYKNRLNRLDFNPLSQYLLGNLEKNTMCAEVLTFIQLATENVIEIYDTNTISRVLYLAVINNSVEVTQAILAYLTKISNRDNESLLKKTIFSFKENDLTPISAATSRKYWPLALLMIDYLDFWREDGVGYAEALRDAALAGEEKVVKKLLNRHAAVDLALSRREAIQPSIVGLMNARVAQREFFAYLAQLGTIENGDEFLAKVGKFFDDGVSPNCMYQKKTALEWLLAWSRDYVTSAQKELMSRVIDLFIQRRADISVLMVGTTVKAAIAGERWHFLECVYESEYLSSEKKAGFLACYRPYFPENKYESILHRYFSCGKKIFSLLQGLMNTETPHEVYEQLAAILAERGSPDCRREDSKTPFSLLAGWSHPTLTEPAFEEILAKLITLFIRHDTNLSLLMTENKADAIRNSSRIAENHFAEDEKPSQINYPLSENSWHNFFVRDQARFDNNLDQPEREATFTNPIKIAIEKENWPFLTALIACPLISMPDKHKFVIYIRQISEDQGNELSKIFEEELKKSHSKRNESSLSGAVSGAEEVKNRLSEPPSIGEREEKNASIVEEGDKTIEDQLAELLQILQRLVVNVGEAGRSVGDFRNGNKLVQETWKALGLINKSILQKIVDTQNRPLLMLYISVLHHLFSLSEKRPDINKVIDKELRKKFIEFVISDETGNLTFLLLSKTKNIFAHNDDFIIYAQRRAEVWSCLEQLNVTKPETLQIMRQAANPMTSLGRLFCVNFKGFDLPVNLRFLQKKDTTYAKKIKDLLALVERSQLKNENAPTM